jgi:hypothetical protein
MLSKLVPLLSRILSWAAAKFAYQAKCRKRL